MTRYNIILLLLAMIGAGLLGGAANFLLLHKDDPEYAKRSRSFVLGPGGFPARTDHSQDHLQRYDRQNLRHPLGTGVPFDFFVFVSLCLLAAVFSRTFAETVAKRLAAEIEKAKRESQEAKPVRLGGRKGQPSRARASTGNGGSAPSLA